VVARFDGEGLPDDPTERFVLTRGFWTEDEANEHAEELDAKGSRPASRYFVLPVRVEDGEVI
jgi:hypothetical protein